MFYYIKNIHSKFGSTTFYCSECRMKFICDIKLLNSSRKVNWLHAKNASYHHRKRKFSNVLTYSKTIVLIVIICACKAKPYLLYQKEELSLSI